MEYLGEEVETDLEALFAGECGVEVSVAATGRVTTKVFTDKDGMVVRVQVTYATRFVITNTETSATYTLRDVGPDRLLFKDGEPVTLQLIGRSTTGSGVIGRTVVDLTGQEPPQSSGKVFGDFVEVVCDAIT